VPFEIPTGVTPGQWLLAQKDSTKMSIAGALSNLVWWNLSLAMAGGLERDDL